MNARYNGGSPLVAPRPVPAQQLAPPSWMLAALPLDVLLGLAGPSHPKKIINDVFFTPEQRHESPQLTPVSDADYVRARPLAAPSDGLEAMDPSADFGLFADLHADTRSVWGEIEAVAPEARQPSPAATVTCDCVHHHQLLVPSAKASPLSIHVAQAKTQCSCAADSDTASLSGESCVDAGALEPTPVRESLRPTVFEELSSAGVDWCRYCGTTEGINWRPGPWGKRTLCNKHGCDYKGYGFASKMPRLNLKSFVDETVAERIRPVLQTFCQICQQPCSEADNVLVHCDGCHRAYHQDCHPDGIAAADVSFDALWYCELSCRDNARRRRIAVELPKCRLPYMCSPRHSQGAATPHDAAFRSATSSPAPHAPRTRKRKLPVCASPEPLESYDDPSPQQPADRLDLHFGRRGSSSSKVRKSSRVIRPSARRLGSDLGV